MRRTPPRFFGDGFVWLVYFVVEPELILCAKNVDAESAVVT
jgi:hypothetical protein